MKVYIETTESPNIIKLKSDEILVNGSYEFDRDNPQNEVPLANKLLEFPFIKKIYYQCTYSRNNYKKR